MASVETCVNVESDVYHWWNIMGRSMRNFHRFEIHELQAEAERRGLSGEGKKSIEKLQNIHNLQ